MLFQFEPTVFDTVFPTADSIDETFPGLVRRVALVDRTERYPFINVAVDKDAVQIVAEIPGVAKEDVNLKLHDGVLTISGERKAPEESKDSGWVRQEIRYGTFTRTVTLPDGIDAEKVSAEYSNGVLTVTVPKLEAAKPKEISIR